MLSAPNLHPLLIHFPIAVFPLLLLIEGAALMGRERRVLSGMATVGWVLAALATLLAWLTGRQAADGLVDVAPGTQLLISDHADLAWITLLIAIGVMSVRLVLWRFDDRRSGIIVGLIASIVLTGIVGTTADHGGALVFQHAVAVALPEVAVPVGRPALAAPTTGSGAAARLVHTDSGTLTWIPMPGDLFAEDTPVQVTGAPLLEPSSDRLRLQVDGQSRILLPSELGDVQVNVWLDLSDFNGTVGLLHHIEGERSGAFTVSTDGTTRLLDSTSTVLDTGTTTLDGEVAIAVNVAGSHLKGLVNGSVVAHGHAVAEKPGPIGLLLNGEGMITLRRLEAIPLLR